MPVFGDPFANPVYPTDVAPATPTPPLVTPAAYFPGAGPMRPGYEPAMVQEPVPDVPAYADPIAMPVSGGMGAMPMQVQTTTEMPLVDSSLQKQFAENERVRQKAQADMLKAMDQQAAAQASTDAMIAEKQREETARLLAKQEAARQEVERREATARQAEEEYKQAKVDPNAFFEGSTGKQIAAALLAGAGAFAATVTGGRNYAGEIIDKAIERDIEAQKIAMAKKGETAKDARKVWEVAQARYENAEEFVRAQNWKTVETQAQAMANKSSNAVQKQNFIMQAADANQKYLQHMAALQPKTTVVQVAGGGTGKSNAKPTEVQSKAQLFAATMNQAEREFGELRQAGYKRESIGSATAAGLLPEALKSEELKRQEKAELAFVDGYIRQTSGANAPEPEVKRAMERFFPRIGDTEKVIQQKQRDRQMAMEQTQRIAAGEAIPDSELLFKANVTTSNRYPSLQRTP